jgi:hypothetical protein
MNQSQTIDNNDNDNNDYDDNNDDDNDCLDTSWIQQEKRIQDIQRNYSREPMDSIRGIFIYINQNNYIDKIIRENIPLQINSPNSSTISPDSLLKIIQTKKLRTPISKYKFSNIFSNVIDIEPDQIQPFSKIDDSLLIDNSFFKETSITNSIDIPSSIFIFHSINTLFYFFQEIPTNKHNLTLKSALKSTILQDQREPDSTISHRNTKKVRIYDKLDPQNIYKKLAKKRGTRKHRT